MVGYTNYGISIVRNITLYNENEWTIDMHNDLDESPNSLSGKKKSIWKLHCRIAFKHSWNNKIRASEERIVFARMGEDKIKVNISIKEQDKGSL